MTSEDLISEEEEEVEEGRRKKVEGRGTGIDDEANQTGKERSEAQKDMPDFSVYSSSLVLSMMVVLLVHGAKNDQPNAVACSMTSSHEDFRAATSTCSRVDIPRISLFKYCVPLRVELCLEFQPTTMVHSHLPSTNFEN